MADPVTNALIAFPCVVFATVLGWRSYRHRAARRTDPTRAGPDATVLVEGRATETSGVETAPISGEQCLFYDLRVERTGPNGLTIYRERGGDTFAVTADGRRTLVDPDEARLDVPSEYRETFEGSELPDRLRTFLEHRIDARGTFEGKLRFVERRIEPGEAVRVIGHARRLKGSSEVVIGPSRTTPTRPIERALSIPLSISAADERSPATVYGAGAAVAAVVGVALLARAAGLF